MRNSDIALIDEVLEIELLTLRNHRLKGSPPLDPVEHRSALATLFEKSSCITVRRNEVLAAYGYLWLIDDDMWFVGGLAVHPELRSISVFRELTASLLSLISDKGITTLRSNVYKANLPSITLHQHLGFKVTRENEFGLEFTLKVAELPRQYWKLGDRSFR